jgi:hypothetical protein
MLCYVFSHSSCRVSVLLMCHFVLQLRRFKSDPDVSYLPNLSLEFAPRLGVGSIITHVGQSVILDLGYDIFQVELEAFKNIHGRSS